MAGGIQVLRFELRESLDSPLFEHVQGITRPPTAYGASGAPAEPEEPPEDASSERRAAYRAALRAWREKNLRALKKERLIVDLGGIGLDQAREVLAHHRRVAKGVRGRKAKPILDVLIAGPPPRGDDDEWTLERVELWGRESLKWLRKRVGPDMKLVVAAVHADETSPHLQALLVPIHQAKLSWKGVRDAAAERIRAERGPQPGRKSRGFRDAYRTLQDDYQEHVGARYGLERGEIGSEATHTSIDRARAAEARAAVAEARAALAERERREAHAKRVQTEGMELLSGVVSADQDREAKRKRDKLSAEVAALEQRAEREAAKLREYEKMLAAVQLRSGQTRRLLAAVRGLVRCCKPLLEWTQSECQKERDKAVAALRRMREASRIREKVEAEVEELKAKGSKLQETHQLLTQRVTDARAMLEQKNSVLKDLDQDAETAVQRSKDAERRVAELDSEIRTREERQLELDGTLADRTKQLGHLDAQVKAISDRLAATTAQAEKAEAERDAARKEAEKARARERAAAEAEKAASRIREKVEAEVEGLEAKRSKLQETHQLLTQGAADARTVAKLSSVVVEDLVQKAKAEVQRSEDAKRRVAELDGTLADRTKQLGHLDAQVKAISDRLAATTAQAKEAEAERDAARKEAEKARAGERAAVEAEKAAHRRYASASVPHVLEAIYNCVNRQKLPWSGRLLAAIDRGHTEKSGIPVIELEEELRREYEKPPRRRRLRDSGHSRT